MRCGTCKNTWHFMPEAPAAERFGETLGALRRRHEALNVPNAINPTVGSPVVAAKPAKKSLQERLLVFKNTKSLSAAFGALLGLVFSYTVAVYAANAAVEYNSALSPVFDAFKIKHAVPGQGLSLRDVRLIPVQTATGHKTLEIKGQVVNESGITRHVPLIEAVIDQKSRDRLLVKAEQPSLESGGHTNFSVSFQGWPAAKTQVRVRFYLP